MFKKRLKRIRRQEHKNKVINRVISVQNRLKVILELAYIVCHIKRSVVNEISLCLKCFILPATHKEAVRFL